jgi:predicted RND superfamily exporter protein
MIPLYYFMAGLLVIGIGIAVAIHLTNKAGGEDE